MANEDRLSGEKEKSESIQKSLVVNHTVGDLDDFDEFMKDRDFDMMDLVRQVNEMPEVAAGWIYDTTCYKIITNCHTAEEQLRR